MVDTAIGSASLEPTSTFNLLIKDWTNGVLVSLVNGVYLGSADKYVLDAKHGVVIPKIGELWPRKVWQYNDAITAPPGTLGYAKLYDLFQYGIIRQVQRTGQLWPRGDYIANAQDEVKIP